MNAAYGNEKFTIHIFLPNNARAPFQTLIYFPPSRAIFRESSQDLHPFPLDFVRSGRAVIYPTFKGTYERRGELDSDYPNLTSTYQEHVISWYKDFSKTIDYLETRPEVFDVNNLIFLGFSWGGAMGTIIPALEERIKICILIAGGFYMPETHPAVDQINYITRIKTPVLMLNGNYDFFFPKDSSARPMFDLWGADPEDKRQVFYDAVHNLPKFEVLKESFNWLERYLGPPLNLNAQNQ